MILTYEGGLSAAEVVLPTRTIVVRRGEEVEVSAEEAEALSHVAGFHPSAQAEKAETPDPEAETAETPKES